jgi:adenosylcobinamide-phosphate synthase
VVINRARAAGLAIGFAADRAFADPARGHPVALFGAAAARLETRIWRDDRRAGVAFAAVCVAAPVVVGIGLERLGRRRPIVIVVGTAAAAWTALGGVSLARAGERMRQLLDGDDLPAARGALSHLCGRDAAGLDAGQLARATVESLAENTSDAVVAPLLWAAFAGIPGVLAYRAINTLDAMVGYHNDRYEHFGWASARLDDVANLVPARLSGQLAVALAPAVGGSRVNARRVLARDGGRHPSPNAGRCEAAFAGALGVRLGGVNRYGPVVESRAELGDGDAPTVADIDRAARLSRLVGVAAVAICILLLAVRGAVVDRVCVRRVRFTRPDRSRGTQT